MTNIITFKMSPVLADALGFEIRTDEIYTCSLIALIGLLAARFSLELSLQAVERQHMTTLLASAAARGVIERESAREIAFDLGGFFVFERPDDLGHKQILAWLTAVFKVYFDIRFANGLLDEISPEDVRSWARVLLDNEILGLGNLPDYRSMIQEGDIPWTISTVAIHLMMAGNPPDVYPHDLIPILEVASHEQHTSIVEDTPVYNEFEHRPGKGARKCI
jgi:hypothetical protein